MTLASQPNALPTNKLAIAALVGPAVTELWPGIMADLWPALAGGPATAALAGAAAALIVGWFVPDRANQAQR